MTLKLAGIAMTTGGILFFTRMIPVMRVVPDDMDFPPNSTTELIRLSELAGTGWQISHLMGLVAVCLFIYGYWVHAKVIKRRSGGWAGTLAAIMSTAAFGAFAVALLIDGFGLPLAAAEYVSADMIARGELLAKVADVHALALTFFTPAIFIMFIAVGLLSSRIIHGFVHKRWLGFHGMFIAVTGPILYLFGLAGPNWDNMQIGGSIMMLAFLWHLLVGIVAWRGRNAQAKD